MLTKQQKAIYRRKLIFIIGDRSVEDIPKNELQQVQQIGKLIGSPIMDHSKPLEPIDFYTFTYEEYMNLIDDGYSVKAIVNALGNQQIPMDELAIREYTCRGGSRMSQVVDDMLDGFICQTCGSFVDGETLGYPRDCEDCEREADE